MSAGVAFIAVLLASGCTTTTTVFRQPRQIVIPRNSTDARIVQRLDSLLREKAWSVSQETTPTLLCHKQVDYVLGGMLLTLRIELTESELLLTYHGVYTRATPGMIGDIEYQSDGVTHRGTFGNRERLYFDEDHCTEAVCSIIRSATNGVRAINGVEKRERD